MKATTEMKIKVSGGRILEAFVNRDGSCTLTINVADVSKEATVNQDDVFVLVEASKLSLDDEFMSHEPKTEEEKEFKQLLTEAIKSGLRDFYRPVFDPSFNENGGICYMQGKKPAVGKTYDWWKKKAIKFMPKRGSRLGTRTEYVAFLGVLMKKLVRHGLPIAEAWNAVCNDSHELGYYWNCAKNVKIDFKPTGSVEIRGFYDLANTFKLLAGDREVDDFWMAGGAYNYSCRDFPLANIDLGTSYFYSDDDISHGVGWLVLEK